MSKTPKTTTPLEAAGPESGEKSVTASQAPAEGDIDIEVEVDPPEPPVPTAEERIAELNARLKESHDKYLRSMAELDNVRKRTRKDMEEAKIDAQSRVLREVLPVIDNLERAAAHAAQAGDGATGGLLEGIRLILRQFGQALERSNVHPIEAGGMPFDPTQHEAVSQVVTADAPAGSVVDVMQTGYRIGDRLLRPALVVVAKAPPASDGEPAGPNGRDPTAES